MIALVPPLRHTLARALALLATGQLGAFHTYLLGLGAWAPVLSIALLVLSALAVPMPVTIVMVANGLAFGLWKGMVISLIGGLIGAAAAYLAGRALGRAAIERWFPAASLEAADRLSRRYGAWAIVLERWIPGVPCDPMGYVAGVTRIPFFAFLGWTLVGLVPANLVTAYVGSEVAGDIPIRYWLSGLALVALGAGGWALWRQRG